MKRESRESSAATAGGTQAVGATALSHLMVGVSTACASAATSMLARLGARLVTAAPEKA
jgi:hypothetical protein